MSRPLRCLWVVSKLSWQGGIGRIAAGAGRALATSRHEMHIAGPIADGPPVALPEVSIHPWPKPHRKMAGLHPLFALQHAIRADVIHFHSAHGHGEAVLGLRVLRRWLGSPKLVVSAHSSRPYTKRRQRLGLRAADALVLPSHWSAGMALQAGARREAIHVVPNGVDPVERPPPEAREPVVLVVGRLVAAKAVDLAIDAFDRAAVTRPEWRLRILGTGPERDRLRRRAAGKACRERIEFLGYVTEEAKLRELPRASIGTVVSERENSPGTLLEFQAHGIPTVASDVGGIPELASDGSGASTAVLVTAGHVEEFAAALGALMDDPARRCEVGDAAYRLARRHTWTAIAESYSRLYARLLSP